MSTVCAASLPPVISLCSRRWLRCLQPCAALLSGILLSLSFPPVEGWWLAFAGFLPLLLVPFPCGRIRRLCLGFLFGYAYFGISFAWLNTVGFGAGALLAIPCALFPAAWYYLASAVLWTLKPRERPGMPPGEAALATRPGAGMWALRDWRGHALFALALPGSWCALEWVRSWIFTGMPWNQLGISQAFVPTRLLATVAGVYGISFVIVLANVLAAGIIVGRYRRASALALAVVASLVVAWCAFQWRMELPQSEPPIRIIAIQGNVPECRVWTEEEFDNAVAAYRGLTLDAHANAPAPADLYLWPEGAIPAPIVYEPYALVLADVLDKVSTPLLIGALDERMPVGGSAANVYNSAFLLRDTATFWRSMLVTRTDYYDKTHLVPFGEFVPFSKHFPWLADVIGMGRDLTPGRSYTLFRLSRSGTDIPLYAGVNICFEDVFPEISRRFALSGAQMLFTITNDCWYKESSGARQHQAHAVFRAVENRLPLMRSGNNSHTCLITPKGEILAPITDADGGDFAAGWHAYDVVPAPKDAPPTLYARTGNLFAWICVAGTLAELLWLGGRLYRRKAALLDVVERRKRRPGK